MPGPPPKPKPQPKPRRKGVTLDEVRRAALALADTEERPSYGTPGFRAQDRLFARVYDSETIVARVDLASRDMILAARPDVFFLTPHYEAYPWVLVRLPAISARELRDILAEAHAVAVRERVMKRAKKARR
jgi:hypothetical protein